MTKTKKIHPADQLDRDAVATAASFNTHFRQSPTSKINRPAATLIEAIAHSDNIKAELALDGVTRKITPLIYAIQANGAQSPVPADMIEAARAAAAQPAASPAESMEKAAEATTKPRGKKVASVSIDQVFGGDPLGYKAARKNRAALNVIADASAPAQAPAAAPKGKRAAEQAAAEAGTIPAAPDFSAETHKRFRGKLAELVALVEAGDVEKLEAYPINPVSSSPKALDKFRKLAVIALKAQAAAK